MDVAFHERSSVIVLDKAHPPALSTVQYSIVQYKTAGVGIRDRVRMRVREREKHKIRTRVKVRVKNKVIVTVVSRENTKMII